MHRHREYLESCRRGFQFLDGLIIQSRDTSLLPNPAMAIGGLRRSTRSSEVCIDFVQHYLAAAIEVRQAAQIVSVAGTGSSREGFQPPQLIHF